MSSIMLPRDQSFAWSHLREHSTLTDEPEMTPKGHLTNRSSKHSSGEQHVTTAVLGKGCLRIQSVAPSRGPLAHVLHGWGEHMHPGWEKRKDKRGKDLWSCAASGVTVSSVQSKHSQSAPPGQGTRNVFSGTDRHRTGSPNCSYTVLCCKGKDKRLPLKTLLFHLLLVPLKRL